MFTVRGIKLAVLLGGLCVSSIFLSIETVEGGVSPNTQTPAEDPPWPPSPPIEGAVENSEMSYTAFDAPAPVTCNEPKVYSVVDGEPDPKPPVSLSEAVKVNPKYGLWDLVTGEGEKTQILFRVAADGRGILEWQSLARSDGVIPQVASVILHSKATPDAPEKTRVYWFTKLDRSGVSADHNEPVPGTLSKISFCYPASEATSSVPIAATELVDSLLPPSTLQAAAVASCCRKLTSGCWDLCARKPCQCH